DYLHARGYASANTHVTLLDEAEIAGLKIAVHDLVAFNSNTKDIYLPIPEAAKWVDNYISYFGAISLFRRPTAANIILRPFVRCRDVRNPINIVPCDHSYAHEWY